MFLEQTVFFMLNVNYTWGCCIYWVLMYWRDSFSSKNKFKINTNECKTTIFCTLIWSHCQMQSVLYWRSHRMQNNWLPISYANFITIRLRFHIKNIKIIYKINQILDIKISPFWSLLNCLLYAWVVSMVCVAQIQARIVAPLTLGDCMFAMQQAAKYMHSSAGW